MYYMSGRRQGRGDWYSIKNEQGIKVNPPIMTSQDKYIYHYGISFRYTHLDIQNWLKEIRDKKLLRKRKDKSIEIVRIFNNDYWRSEIFTLIPKEELK